MLVDSFFLFRKTPVSANINLKRVYNRSKCRSNSSNRGNVPRNHGKSEQVYHRTHEQTRRGISICNDTAPCCLHARRNTKSEAPACRFVVGNACFRKYTRPCVPLSLRVSPLRPAWCLCRLRFSPHFFTALVKNLLYCVFFRQYETTFSSRENFLKSTVDAVDAKGECRCGCVFVGGMSEVLRVFSRSLGLSLVLVGVEWAAFALKTGFFPGPGHEKAHEVSLLPF
jgi:hypothetical protein